MQRDPFISKATSRLFYVQTKQYEARSNDGTGRTAAAQAMIQLLALLVTLCTHAHHFNTHSLSVSVSHLTPPHVRLFTNTQSWR